MVSLRMLPPAAWAWEEFTGNDSYLPVCTGLFCCPLYLRRLTSSGLTAGQAVRRIQRGCCRPLAHIWNCKCRVECRPGCQAGWLDRCIHPHAHQLSWFGCALSLLCVGKLSKPAAWTRLRSFVCGSCACSFSTPSAAHASEAHSSTASAAHASAAQCPISYLQFAGPGHQGILPPCAPFVAQFAAQALGRPPPPFLPPGLLHTLQGIAARSAAHLVRHFVAHFAAHALSCPPHPSLPPGLLQKLQGICCQGIRPPCAPCCAACCSLHPSPLSRRALTPACSTALQGDEEEDDVPHAMVTLCVHHLAWNAGPQHWCAQRHRG